MTLVQLLVLPCIEGTATHGPVKYWSPWFRKAILQPREDYLNQCCHDTFGQIYLVIFHRLGMYTRERTSNFALGQSIYNLLDRDCSSSGVLHTRLCDVPCR